MTDNPIGFVLAANAFARERLRLPIIALSLTSDPAQQLSGTVYLEFS